MLNHPLSLFGALLVALGFFLLIFWVPTEIPGMSVALQTNVVYNLHRASISQAIIFLGGAIMIVGVLARGFEEIRNNIGAASPEKVGMDSRADTETHVSETFNEADFDQIMPVSDRQGRIRELRVSTDGRVILDTLTGKKVFPSVQAAKSYLD